MGMILFPPEVRRRVAPALVVLALAAGAVPLWLASPEERSTIGVDPVAVAPAAGDVTINLEGRGWGHGLGLSQWGAYGYAVEKGWTAAQILDLYYGNTVSGTLPADSVVSVRLQALDGAPTAVVSEGGRLEIVGVSATMWKSVVSVEVSEGVYAVWARADAQVCPAPGADLGATGWTLVSGGVSGQVDVRSADDVASPAPTVQQLPALCEPSGTVRTYRGVIRAVNDAAGSNRTVNIVPVEQYLRSVIAKEMSPSWASAGNGNGIEALKAQAVAARTYAMAETRAAYAKTCDTQSCQVYAGVATRTSLGAAYISVEFPSTDAAVSATAGIVRRLSSGALAYTYFSASSGGYTAPGPGGLAPFPAVPDEGDATSANPSHEWTATLTGSQISAKYPAIGTFVSLKVTNRNGYGEWGGRVTQVRIDGTAGWVAPSGWAFRSAFGLKSDWFNVLESTPVTDGCNGRNPPPVVEPLAAAAPATFNPITPLRLIDTRSGLGTARMALGAGCTLVVDPLLPPSATAVTVNIAAINPQLSGHVTVYPCGTERPLVSVLAALAGRTVAATTVTRLGLDGTFCVYSYYAAEMVIDLYGWYSASEGVPYQPIVTKRLLDTRSGSRLAAGSTTRVMAVRSGAAPAGATGAALTLHSTDAVANGHIIVYPCTAPMPEASALNVTAGISITNHVQVAVPPTGEICVFVSSSMHVVADMSGWFGSGATTRFYALMPYRALDTRFGIGLSGAFGAGTNRAVALAPSPANGLPDAANVAAVFAVVTAVAPQKAGYLTVHACQSPVPQVSMVRFATGLNAASAVAGLDDAQGRWCIYSSAWAHVLVDVSGYFA